VIDSTWGSRLAVNSQHGSVGVHESKHSNSAQNQGGATAPAVDPEKSRNRAEDVDHVLNAGRDQKVVSLETSHSEDVSESRSVV